METLSGYGVNGSITDFHSEGQGSNPCIRSIFCKQCGEQFITRDKRRRFCSKNCSQLSRRTGQTVVCACCGKEIYRKGYSLSKSKHKVYFCSKKCQDIGQSDYSDGSNCYGQELNKPRSLCQMYYPIVVCSNCGYSEHPPLVEAHHIDSDQKNNSSENLIWLCSLCHRAVTLGLAQIEKREFQWKTEKSSVS